MSRLLDPELWKWLARMMWKTPVVMVELAAAVTYLCSVAVVELAQYCWHKAQERIRKDRG